MPLHKNNGIIWIYLENRTEKHLNWLKAGPNSIGKLLDEFQLILYLSKEEFGNSSTHATPPRIHAILVTLFIKGSRALARIESKIRLPGGIFQISSLKKPWN